MKSKSLGLTSIMLAFTVVLLSSCGQSPSDNQEETPSALAIKVLDTKLGQGTAESQTFAAPKKALVKTDSRSLAVFDLLSPANGAWASGKPTFTWQSSSGSNGYDLFIDDNLTQSLSGSGSTSYTLTTGQALANGFHTWYVEAKDSGGNRLRSTSTRSVRVDATTPQSFELIAPASDTWFSTSSITYQWSASTDANSGLHHYELFINNTAVLSNISPSTTSITTAFPSVTIFSDSINAGCAGWSFSSGACYNPGGGYVLSLGSASKSLGNIKHSDVTLSFSYNTNAGSSNYYQVNDFKYTGLPFTNYKFVSKTVSIPATAFGIASSHPETPNA